LICRLFYFLSFIFTLIFHGWE